MEVEPFGQHLLMIPRANDFISAQVIHLLIVGEAGKNGFWYEWDELTGEPFSKPIAFVKQDHMPPTEEGTLVWPGPAGGANYGPSAFVK